MRSFDRAGSLEELLGIGWDRHAEESEPLADALEAAAAGGVSDDAIAPFVHLSTHVIGEHLGDWPRALALGKRVLACRTPVAETAKAWARLSVAATLAGDAVEAVELELCCLRGTDSDVETTLLEMRFMLIAALVGTKRAGDAARLYQGAIDLAGRIGQSPSLHRMIAAASNNLGWELYEAASRTAEEQALMIVCAETSLAFWDKCGSWINVEQAHYLAALVAGAAGEPASALAHADAALAIIAANGERPLDSALLHLARAVSLAALGDDEGKAGAIGEADASAARLTAGDLRARFAAERARVVAR